MVVWGPFTGVMVLKEKGIWSQESWISELVPAFARSMTLGEAVKLTGLLFLDLQNWNSNDLPCCGIVERIQGAILESAV